MAKKKHADTPKKAGRPRTGMPEELQRTDKGRIGQRIGQHLLELFQRSGLTTCELADAVGVTKATVNHYLAGTKLPRVDKWEALATALRLKDLNSLFPYLPIE